ncbi:TPA: hypothetical protein ACH3X1_015514 [Trebouxia sp. C0004]
MMPFCHIFTETTQVNAATTHDLAHESAAYVQTVQMCISGFKRGLFLGKLTHGCTSQQAGAGETCYLDIQLLCKETAIQNQQLHAIAPICTVAPIRGGRVRLCLAEGVPKTTLVLEIVLFASSW